MGLLTKIVVAVLLGLLLQYLVKLATVLDVNEHVFDHEPGPCRLLEGVVGSEDMALLKDGVVLITSGIKFGSGRSNPKINTRPGQIMKFDMSSPTKPVISLKIEGKVIEKGARNFSPQGISVWEDKQTGATTVFVNNHPFDKDYDTVEKFTYDRSRDVLIHVQTITDSKIRSTNNVLATGPNSFYLTNQMYYIDHTMQKVETLAMFAWGSIVYFDGQKFTVVADNVLSPNGIAMSADGKWLYISKPNGQQLGIYARKPDNMLEHRKDIDMHTATDNLFVEPTTGDLWAGAHPVRWQTLSHFEDPLNVPSPSQVLRMKISGGDVTFIEEVLADSGKRIYASTAAVYRQGALLVSSIYHKMLYCEVKHLA